MACGATLSLKRSLEFDPVHSPNSRSPKRRRCVPMTLSPSAPPTKQHQTNPSPFSEVTPKLTSDQIALHISSEIKRMHRRRQLNYPMSPSSMMSPSSSPPHSGSSTPPHPGSHGDMMAGTSQLGSPSTSSMFNPLSPSKKDMPLFTLRQVGLVCERMLKEREAAIRAEYDQVLTTKLAEQYEAFLKFNHDQLARRFGGECAASYVS